MPRKVNHVDPQDVATLYLQGVGPKDLAKRFHVRDAEIIRLIGEAGVTYIPHRLPLDGEEIVRRHRAGESVKSIATSLECSVNSVARRLSVAGVALSKRLPLDDAEIVRRYLAGESQKDIAASLGCSVSPIYRRLVAAGIPIRPVAECIRLGMERQSPERREKMVEAAHRATKGCTQGEEYRCKIAATREARGLGIVRTEELLAELLLARGYTCTLQKAIGRYNIDLALHAAPVAVEIFGGQWHSAGRHAARFRKRTDYIINAGWYPVCIWVLRDYPLEAGAVEQIVTLTESLRLGEPVRRQELMMYGNGKPSAIGKNNLD